MKRRRESRDNADSIDNSNTLVSRVHQNEVSDNIYQQYLRGELCDVTLIAGDDGKRIAAHRLVLTAASEYIRALLAAPSKESIEYVFTMSHIAGDILKTIIEFCYTGTIQLTNANVDGIMAAVSMMQLDRLEELCEEYLICTLNRCNWLELLVLATHYKYKRLIHRVDTFVMDNFQHLIHENEFLHAKIEALEMLLKNDHLFVFSEEVIFSAIVRWIEFDEDNRKSMFKQLMAFVRIDQLQMAFFTNSVFEYCNKWNSLELFVDMLKQRNNHQIIKSPRITTIKPIPFIVGSSSDACKRSNEFVLKKLDFHQNEWRKIHSFPGYREGHSVVQVDHFLYIIGGKDIDGTILNTVQRLNLKSWTLDDIQPMAHHRTGLLSVYLNGSIYVIYVENNKISFERYNYRNENWLPIKSFECIFKVNGAETVLIYRDMIFIINSHSMICYDPKCATVVTKAAPHFNLDKNNLFIENDQLVTVSIDPTNTKHYLSHSYNYILDKWQRPEATPWDMTPKNWIVLRMVEKANHWFRYCLDDDGNESYMHYEPRQITVLACGIGTNVSSHHDLINNFLLILPANFDWS